MSAISSGPIGDPERLAALRRLNLLDTRAEEAFDRLTRLALRSVGAPTALITLIDVDREFCKSAADLHGRYASGGESGLESSICRLVVEQGAPLSIEDTTAHPVVCSMPPVTAGRVGAYLGVPLTTGGGFTLGSLCVLAPEARAWSEEDMAALEDLAAATMTELDLRVEVAERQRAEAQVVDVLESITDAFFALDSEWRFTYVNDAAEDLLRRSRGELLGTRIWDVFPEAVGTTFERQYRRAREGGVAVAFEEYYGPLDLWVEVRAYPSDDGLSVYFRDAGERKRAEEAIRASEAKFQQLVRHVDQAFWIYDPDFATTLYVSPRASEIFGLSEETLYQDARAFLQVVHPDDLHDLTSAMQKVKDHALEPCEYRIQRPDGVVRRLQSRAFPVRDLDGRVQQIVGVTKDVTTEHARESRMRLLTGALESFEEGVSLTNSHLGILYANAAWARILGPDPDATPGWGIERLLPDDAARAQLQEIQRTLVEEGQWRGRVWRRHASDDRIVPLDLFAGRVEGADGERNFFFIAHDATETVEQENRLRRMERLASIGTLVSGVAHELNNPLHAIRNFADLMLLDERSAEERETLGIIQREADRASKVVSDLRIFARRTQENDKAPREAVDLNDIVRHVLKVRHYVLETGNVEVREDLAENLAPVLANRSEVEQMILNLVTNADQAMQEQKGPRRLILRTRQTLKGASVHVVDSGPGIPPEHLARIYDPFWTTKSPGQGTGLGLSLVHSIVAEHGGEIHVDSEVGRGTAFRITLPRAPVENAAIQEKAISAAPVRPGRILIVDDEDAIRRVTVRFLTRMGYHVDAAAEGGEALRLLGQAEYDVIFSDLKMPGLGGEALFQRLQERGGGLERRLIFVTGDAASAQTAHIASGFNVPVLMKPLRLEELARAVEAMRQEHTSAGR